MERAFRRVALSISRWAGPGAGMFRRLHAPPKGDWPLSHRLTRNNFRFGKKKVTHEVRCAEYAWSVCMRTELTAPTWATSLHGSRQRTHRPWSESQDTRPRAPRSMPSTLYAHPNWAWSASHLRWVWSRFFSCRLFLYQATFCIFNVFSMVTCC